MELIIQNCSVSGIPFIAVLLGNVRCQNVFAGSQFPRMTADITANQLQSKVHELESVVYQLKEDVKMLKADRAIHKNGPQQAFSQNQGTRQVLDNANIILPITAKGSEVGFHVNLMHSFILSTGNTLLFDNVITNIGRAFDQPSGTFTCPVTGTYIFALNVVCDKTSFMHLSIFKNSYPVFNSLCDNRSGLIWSQGSGTTILRLKYGDKVRVSMIWPMNSGGTAYGHGMTSFSGYLLRAK